MSEAEKTAWVAKAVDYGRAYKSVYIRVEKSETPKVNTPTVTVASTSTPKPTVVSTTKPTSTPESKSTAVSTETSSSITTKSDSEKTLFSKTTTCHSANGTVSVYYYEYDAVGTIKRFCERNEYGVNITTTEYEYDSWKRVTKITYNGSSKDSSWTTYKYDDKGNVISSESYYSSGKNKHKSTSYTLEYDEKDRLIKKKLTYGWEEYEYDNSGNLIKETTYESNYSIRSMRKYEYDKSGNKIKCSYYTGEKLDCSYKYEYDNSNNLIKETEYDSKGTSVNWTKYEYNEKGLEIKSTSSSGAWSESEYSYI